MSKLAQSTSKYTIILNFKSKGVVEKPDVIGAVFGQTEGLLGPDMDLRELQRTGRIGRIEVEIKSTNGNTEGVIKIPSSLDTSETALIAATLETIDRVGPCDATIEIEKVSDIRAEKRKYVVERAKEILKKTFEEGFPETQEIAEEIKEAVRSSEVTEFMGLPAGPGIKSFDSIVVCEGRADVLKLVKNGIKNVIAIEGSSVPKAVVDLSKTKTTTVFLDGDRGGDLILKEMFQKSMDIDFVARAPRGKEVEDLTKKEIYKALRDKIPADQAKTENETSNTHNRHYKENNHQRTVRPAQKKFINNKLKESFKNKLTELTGTRAAMLFDGNMKPIGKIPVKEMFSAIKEVENVETIIFDGAIDQKLIDFASEKNIKNIVGMSKNIGLKSKDVRFYTKNDV